MNSDQDHSAPLTCSNCGTALPSDSNFCHSCGQDVHSHKKPVVHFILETLENTIHFDTKLIRSLRDLFIKPGLVTINYNNDRRARYVPPVRLYVFISFIFFLVLNLTNADSISIPETEIQFTDAQQKEQTAPTDFLTSEEIELLSSKEKLSDEVIDSMIIAKKGEPSMLSRNLFRMLHHNMSGQAKESDFRHKLFKNISLAMFLLMPVFGLLLQLFFFRAKKFYIEHLVFSLHFHTLIFLILLASVGIGQLTSIDLTIVIFTGIVLYLLLALRNVYGGKWVHIVLKTAVITFNYFICIAFSLLASTVLSAI